MLRLGQAQAETPVTNFCFAPASLPDDQARAVQFADSRFALGRCEVCPVDLLAALQPQLRVVDAPYRLASGPPASGEAARTSAAHQIDDGLDHLRIVCETSLPLLHEV